MNRRRTTKAKRDGAVGRILRGETTSEAEARRLHVKPAAVKGWVTMARKGTRAGRPRKSAPPLEGKPVEEREDASASRRLERALSAAEIGHDTGEGDGETTHEPDAASAPPPEPEELVAFTETIRTQALKLYAGVLGFEPGDPRIQPVLEFSERERAALKIWAPYAAKFVPVLVGRSEEVGAWIFVGVNLASLWTAMALLRRMAPKKAPREPGATFPGPGDPDAKASARQTTTPPNEAEPFQFG